MSMDRDIHVRAEGATGSVTGPSERPALTVWFGGKYVRGVKGAFLTGPHDQELEAVEYVPADLVASAVAAEHARIVARIRREASETFDLKLDHELRDLAALIESEGAA